MSLDIVAATVLVVLAAALLFVFRNKDKGTPSNKGTGGGSIKPKAPTQRK
jgi:hypothetical protein